MSRYIDADALKNKLQQHHDFFVNAWGGFREMPIQDKARCDELSNSIAEIYNAPSIGIVFCEECKKSKICRSNGEFYRWCSHNIKRVKDNDFCSDGERREP